jgi:peptide-methionine (S)-S-oxide reductase
VVPLKTFYPAEEYHQDFMKRNPNNMYIRIWDVPKVKHLKEAFPELVAQS